eukprot:COSAG02_NODE_14725_length_1242_cov_31.609993_3_plen_26_part_01
MSSSRRGRDMQPLASGLADRGWFAYD